ncbi:MAG TPA: tetratricopeptide repeat protein [Tepidisphaeraceae bacterium]|nr:tetratricopeptide repeat protein [Tepidisphaeraceae bacterium]
MTTSPRLPTASFLLCCAALAAVAGCAKQAENQPWQKGSGSTSHAPTDPFDQVREPAITADTRFAAGQLAESRGRFDQAIEQYREATKADPRHKAATFRLAMLLTAGRQYPAAVEAWNKYLTLTHGSAVAWANLGLCHGLAGNTAAAEAAFRKGIEVDPKSQPVRVNYGLMLAKAQRFADATAQWSAVLPPAQVHYNLGSVYEQLNRLDDARNEYRKALAADPGFGDARSRLDALADAHTDVRGGAE